LRWWIGGILFASTVINYIDRQTLSLLAPYLKLEYHWTNTDYANIVIAFRVAYSIGQTVFADSWTASAPGGSVHHRRCLFDHFHAHVRWRAAFTALPLFRFLLGAGESANWPAATKAVSEWFPKRERGLATALFDSGSSIGGAIGPFIILWIYFRWAGARRLRFPYACFLWLIVWRWLYHPPESHPNISEAERELLAADKRESRSPDGTHTRLSWRDLSNCRKPGELSSPGRSPIRSGFLSPTGSRFI